GFVLADLLDIHLHVELFPHPAQEQELRRQPRERRADIRREVDLVGGAGEVVLLVGPADLALEERQHRLPGLLEIEQRVADVLPLRPADIQKIDPYDEALAALVAWRGANHPQEVDQRALATAEQATEDVLRRRFQIAAAHFEDEIPPRRNRRP